MSSTGVTQPWETTCPSYDVKPGTPARDLVDAAEMLASTLLLCMGMADRTDGGTFLLGTLAATAHVKRGSLSRAWSLTCESFFCADRKLCTREPFCF